MCAITPRCLQGNVCWLHGRGQQKLLRLESVHTWFHATFCWCQKWGWCSGLCHQTSLFAALKVILTSTTDKASYRQYKDYRKGKVSKWQYQNMNPALADTIHKLWVFLSFYRRWAQHNTKHYREKKFTTGWVSLNQNVWHYNCFRFEMFTDAGGISILASGMLNLSKYILLAWYI